MLLDSIAPTAKICASIAKVLDRIGDKNALYVLLCQAHWMKLVFSVDPGTRGKEANQYLYELAQKHSFTFPWKMPTPFLTLTRSFKPDTLVEPGLRY
jgi:hypothetical protein